VADAVGGKKKIAILGGGAGAMSAAFGITSRPNWQDEYEITVYQMGWRLGGKGASGRNADISQRIEEHGIHLWFGFYQNAFGMMRSVYAELAERQLAPGSPFQSWTDAFTPQSGGGFIDKTADGWRQLAAHFPAASGEPGDPSVFTESPSTWQLFLQRIDDLADRYDRQGPEAKSAAQAGPSLPEWLNLLLAGLSAAVKTAEHSTLLHLAKWLAHRLDADPRKHSPLERSGLLHLLQGFADRFFADIAPELDDDWRLLAEALDFGISSLVGILADGVLEKGFSAIDDRDLSDWLKAHGARYPDSALVLSLYDAVFAYEHGDPLRRRLSAGVALYGNLLMSFTYRGCISYRMCAGMGDTIFAPIYLVLANRGVRFRFFHRVEELRLSPDGRTVKEIEIDVQATPRSGEYQPLVTVKGLPCWPSAPRYDQLQEGGALREGHYNLESAWSGWHGAKTTLKRGVDFDEVVFGISLGGVPWVAKELIEGNARWRDMVDYVGTVQTQAMQLWMNRTSAELGTRQPADAAPLFTSYVEPFDTYADFSHLIPREDWPAGTDLRQIAYFCNALDETGPVPAPGSASDFPERERNRVMANGRSFLEQHASGVWPALAGPGLDQALLIGSVERQYFRANIDPSERYVLSLPGSTQYRLAPGDSGFANLYLAGDWTLTALNCGCVEAAVMSGLMASQAMCGYPQRVFGAPQSQTSAAG
jgi:uncharacterized protein with NAD-binding domain and iron-sulfur cluster